MTLENLPYKIIPGEIASYRDSIFVERAVVGERLRLALGMPLRRFSEYSKLSEGIVENEIAEKYYEPPLINVIKFACNKCPDNVVTVTSGCQGCIEHPCMRSITAASTPRNTRNIRAVSRRSGWPSGNGGRSSYPELQKSIQSGTKRRHTAANSAADRSAARNPGTVIPGFLICQMAKRAHKAARPRAHMYFPVFCRL